MSGILGNASIIFYTRVWKIRNFSYIAVYGGSVECRVYVAHRGMIRISTGKYKKYTRLFKYIPSSVRKSSSLESSTSNNLYIYLCINPILYERRVYKYLLLSISSRSVHNIKINERASLSSSYTNFLRVWRVRVIDLHHHS